MQVWYEDMERRLRDVVKSLVSTQREKRDKQKSGFVNQYWANQVFSGDVNLNLYYLMDEDLVWEKTAGKKSSVERITGGTDDEAWIKDYMRIYKLLFHLHAPPPPTKGGWYYFN